MLYACVYNDIERLLNNIHPQRQGALYMRVCGLKCSMHACMRPEVLYICVSAAEGALYVRICGLRCFIYAYVRPEVLYACVYNDIDPLLSNIHPQPQYLLLLYQ